jgi:phenylacetate-CoA ligase
MQMMFDFLQLPLQNNAFSEKPMTFCDAGPKQVLSTIIDLVAIETGRRKARENWQKAQLRNLLKHAHERSLYWRERIGTKKINDIKLSDLPILTRSDVVHQVKTEGSLLRQSDETRAKEHSTSGSSGMPVKFFISEMNVRYNQTRSLTQYFMEGRDLSLNRVRFRPFDYNEVKRFQGDLNLGFIIESTDNWLGPLGSFVRSGVQKHVKYWHPNREFLFEELSKDPIGYLVIQPRLLETLFRDGDISFLKNNAVEMLITLAEELSWDLRRSFGMKSIPVRTNYSSEEVGFIGWECHRYPSHYHVAHSNVIVEVDKVNNVAIGGRALGRILITHMHSYATPFIRYDVGDLGALTDACRCGHDGPTISNILGRAKNIVKHPDGKLTVFNIRAKDLMKLAKFNEYRVRQVTSRKIILEIGGCDNLTEDQRESFVELIRNHAGGDFNIDVIAVNEIDWGRSIKRPAFRNELICQTE